MLWVFHFNHSPGVETTTDLLSLYLNQLVGANHSEGNAGLEKEDTGQRILRLNQRFKVWKRKIRGRQGLSVPKQADGRV